MIKCDDGKVSISGKGIDIIAEFTCLASRIIHALAEIDGKYSAVSMLKESIDVAALTDEELQQKLDAKLEALSQENREKILADFLKGLR